MPDENGYPTEKEILTIKNWNVVEGDVMELVEYVRTKWWQRGWGFTLEDDKLELHTGGWSGNEEIIGALQSNTMFWMFYWEQSKRGGHYYFDLTRYRKKENGEKEKTD